jgi:hypothetical protein
MREVEASQRVKERGGGLAASEGERWRASAGIGWSNAKRSGQAGWHHALKNRSKIGRSNLKFEIKISKKLESISRVLVKIEFKILKKCVLQRSKKGFFHKEQHMPLICGALYHGEQEAVCH